MFKGSRIFEAILSNSSSESEVKLNMFASM